MRLLVALATLLVAAGVLVLAVPLAGDRLPIAQLVSFRAALGLVLLTLGVLTLVVPPTRRQLAALGVALLVGGLAQGAVLAARSRPTSAATDAAGDLVVLSFNTEGRVGGARLAAIALAERADVLALPETSAATAQDTARALAAAGRPMQVFTAASRLASTDGVALLVSTALGSYRQVQAPDLRLGAVAAAPSVGRGPTLVAVHPVAPTLPVTMPGWRAEGRVVARVCATTPGAIVAGDLNATLDHPALAVAPCIDAARAVGAAARGTWPASVPTWLAAPIDHVLVDPSSWRVAAVQVLPDAGSDHRPLLARLSRT